jgi:NAD(P)-dependent dehydrogenase (short-subunit alcohol dehydrogenase family)
VVYCTLTHTFAIRGGEMKILVIGATGTIGSALVEQLGNKVELITASRSSGSVPVDIADPESVKRLFSGLSDLDAVVCTVGVAPYAPLFKLSDADFEKGLHNKLMGQVNVVRFGVQALAANGSFTLTGGLASRHPFESGGALISMCNAGLEGFVKAASRELPRNIRLNVIAPGWVRETLVKLKMDPIAGVPALRVAERYVDAIRGSMTGQVLDIS